MARFARFATLDELDQLTLGQMLALGILPAPIAGAGDDPDPDPDPSDPDPDPDDPEDSDPADPEDPEADPKPKSSEPNWKAMSRKHEREAKKRQKELDDLKAKLKEREDADQSEQEKAIEQAKRDAVSELETKHEKERRQDRLEVASTKLAAKGLKIGEGDKAKTLKFADADDALVYLERDIERGTLDAEDLFDDRGRVKDDVLSEALTDLLERKPHLAAEGKPVKVKGSADAGKGSGADTGDTSVDDQLKRIRRHRPDQPPSYVVSRRQ